MLGQILNELTFTLELQPQGPLLVKAGEETCVTAEKALAGGAGATARLLMKAGEDTSVTAPPADLLPQPPLLQMSFFEKRKERDAERREALKEASRQRRQEDRRKQQAARQAKQPILVGQEAETEADMRFVRTHRRGHCEPYLPGSSLKGVLRSSAERLARSMTLAGDAACNPFTAATAATDRPCWHRLGDPDAPQRQVVTAAGIYRQLCVVCKLFGAPFLAGRLQISDAYLVEPGGDTALPRRDGVGIDRRRGAAADGAKYDYEYWNGGAFQAKVRLQNFELWQVGLLAHLLYTLEIGGIPIGFGTRRGLGAVQGVVTDLQISYYGRLALAAPATGLPLLGLGQVAATDPALAPYGFWPDEPAQLEPAHVQLLTPGGRALRRSWAVPTPERLWEVVGPRWTPQLCADLTTARLA